MNVRDKCIGIIRSSARLSAPVPAEVRSIDYTRRAVGGAISAVVFDVYGTLFSSAVGDIHRGEAAEGEALEGLLRRFGIRASASALQQGLKASVLAEHAAKRALGVDCPEVDIRAIWRALPALSHLSAEDIALFACEYECIVNPLAPMPAAREVLEGLSAAGYALGIVSNAQFYTPFLFEALLGKGLGELGFSPELCLWSYEFGYAKPSPLLFQILAQRLAGQVWADGARIHQNKTIKYTAENTLYIGNDMLNDVWAAQQIGFQSAIFTGDSRSFRPRTEEARCADTKADYALAQLDELLLLLQACLYEE